MNEIKETLAILKRRWHEVSLLIGLWFLFRLITLIFRTYPIFPPLVSIVPLGISLYALVVWMGFLRTVYLEPEQKRSLVELVQIGKHFFLRFLVLGLLCGAIMMGGGRLFRVTGLADATSSYVSSPLITILLAKLIILLPAIIFVTDCSISKSFSIMWKIRLLKAKPLVIFFLITRVVLPTLVMLLFPEVWKAHSPMNWGDAIYILYYIASSVMGLMVSVMAIRFVASLEMTESLTALLPRISAEKRVGTTN
jgi:hypothetical protein